MTASKSITIQLLKMCKLVYLGQILQNNLSAGYYLHKYRPKPVNISYGYFMHIINRNTLEKYWPV